MTDARRLAQIGVFLYGLSELDALVSAVLTLMAYSDHKSALEPAVLFVPVGHAVFVLSLLFLSGGWAAVAGVPGVVSRFSDVGRDDILRAGVPLLGLYFLVSGVSMSLASLVEWVQYRSAVGTVTPDPLQELLNTAALLRAVAGAALVLWGTNVVALIQWARSLGGGTGAA